MPRRFAFKPGPRNYDRTWIRDGSSQALALLWAGLIEEAKSYVVWYAERIYENGMVPPILNMDGTVNRGYGSDIEYDAQGEFVGIAADVYRISQGPRLSRTPFSSPWSARRGSSRSFARAPTRCTARKRAFHGLLAPSISHEGYSKPSYSYWDDYFALSALAKLRISRARDWRCGRRGSRQSERPGVRREPHALDPDDRRGDED